MSLENVMPSVDPIPRSKGNEGCGEGVDYRGKTYYYRVGLRIPKTKVVALKWEGDYCGRVHGEVEYIYVAWNGTSFSVLSHEYFCTTKYKGMTTKEAIDFVEAANKKMEDEIAAMPKCKCGNVVFILEEEQQENECFICCRARIGEGKTNVKRLG